MKIFGSVLERLVEPGRSWASDNAVSIPVAAHTLQCPLPPIPYNNKHTHTHTCCGCIPQKDHPRYGAQQSVPLSLTSMHPLVHPPTDPGGKYQLTNLSPRAPKLCKSAICRGTTAACRSAPELQAGEECRKRKIGVSPSGIVEDWAVVHPSPSDIIKGRIVELKM